MVKVFLKVGSRETRRGVVPLLMCGGGGTRLWPASREVRPKQFRPLFGKRSTFQDTILRVSDLSLFELPIAITDVAYRFMVLEQLAEIGTKPDVLLGPMRRDAARQLLCRGFCARFLVKQKIGADGES